MKSFLDIVYQHQVVTMKIRFSNIGDWIEDPKTWNFGAILGVLVVVFYAFPYIFQGSTSIIGVHDNLDSDLVWFHLLSESTHTFSVSNEITVDSVMGGELPRNALPPALNGVTLLFSFLPSITAYLTNFFIVRIVGVISMYAFLVRYVFSNSGEGAYAIPIALAYGLLPYHGLHPGIAISGLPIVALSFANLNEGRQNLMSCLLLIIYGLYSSLLYVGVFVLIIIGTGALSRYLLGSMSNTGFRRVALGSVLLAVTYVVAELNLFNLYFFSDFVSHREEYDPIKLGTVTDFAGAVRRSVGHFLTGHYHASSLHSPFLISGVLAVGGIAVYRWFAIEEETIKSVTKDHLGWLLTVLTLLTAISCLYGFWKWVPFVRAREGFGILSKIQFDRFYWLFPFLWTLAFAIGVVYLRRKWKFLRPAVFLLAVLQLVFVVWSNGKLRANYMQVLDMGTPAGPTYKEFYSPQLFNEIKASINAPPEDYRVVSVGLFPDIAAYNGFQTLDSYQRLYPLKYKHKFRDIIAPELKKDDEIRRYFDYWGSRCYMFSAELGKGNYFIPKNEAEPVKVDYNTQALREMNGKYIISAVPLSNAPKNDLTLVSSFENNTSPYRLHLYSVD